LITKESIEKLKSSINILDVVSDYIEVKKAGTIYKARCPFHDEKTASFVISPQKNFFKCFGCGVAGDSIKFVMDYEKLDYITTIEKLATQHNITLEYTTTQYRVKPKILDKFRDFFIEMLQKNSIAMKYLTNRGLSVEIIEKFEIGYAPDSYKQIELLKKLFISREDAINEGVFGIDDRGNFFSRFVDRIIFPIYNQNSILVGFGGRTISNHPAKYINSVQSEIFNKSKLLYGLHLSKDSIIKAKNMIITEGYLDVVMMYQSGFKNVVATLGTALTKEHIPIISKFTDDITLCFDGDNAGITASTKASKLLSTESKLSGGVVIFDNNMDPADIIKNRDIELLSKKLNQRERFVHFFISRLKASFDDNDIAFTNIQDYISLLSPIKQQDAINFASSILGINERIFRVTKEQNKTLNSNRFDITELSLIKTIASNIEVFEYHIREFLNPDMFEFHRKEFEDLTNNIENDNINNLYLNDKIITIDDSEKLKETIIYIQYRFFQKKMLQVKVDNSISYSEKIKRIKFYNTSIIKLQNRELVNI
jgi:DNA primase